MRSTPIVIPLLLQFVMFLCMGVGMYVCVFMFVCRGERGKLSHFSDPTLWESN